MGIKAVSKEPVPLYQAPAYGKPGYMLHVTNLDSVNPIYYETTMTITDDSNIIYPLGSASFDGAHDIWASTLNRGITVLVQTGIPGQRDWKSGPKFDAMSTAQQIATLGLAQDSSLALINATMSGGISPSVPNVQSVSVLDGSEAGSPYVAYTFTSAGRVWGVNLAAAVASSPTVTGEARVYVLAQIDGNGIPGNGTPLAVCEMAAISADTVDSDNVYVPFNGLDVASGQKLYVICNGNVAVVGAEITASAIFFYSIP